MLIETNSVSKLYGNITALDQLNLRVQKGAIGLLGPNGAGKTTLLKVLLGLTHPTRGSGRVLDKDIFSSSLEIRQQIGYMPENDCFIPEMNAVTYLMYLGRLSGLSRYDAMQRAHETLYYVRIGDERYRNIETYSTGMKQKIKLAQTLVHDPQLIFLDEPTLGLDPHGRAEMLDLIKKIAAMENKSIIFSSHILPDIEFICKNVIILNEGKLIKYGNIKQLLQVKNPDIVVKIKGDKKAFITKLKHIGLEAEERGTNILVKNEQNVMIRIIRTASEQKVQLRQIDKSTRNLEDLFIELLGNR